MKRLIASLVATAGLLVTALKLPAVAGASPIPLVRNSGRWAWRLR